MSPLLTSASSSLGFLTTNPKIVTNGLVLHLDAEHSQHQKFHKTIMHLEDVMVYNLNTKTEGDFE